MIFCPHHLQKTILQMPSKILVCSMRLDVEQTVRYTIIHLSIIILLLKFRISRNINTQIICTNI